MHGDLGAGKTTFTKGIGIGLGLNEADITSPSFSLVAEHRNGKIPIYHLDVYRLNSPNDLYGLGFDDYVRASDGLIVIEWADLVGDVLPKDRLVITISAGEHPNERIIHAQEHGPASRRLLEGVP
jgi:tRNA threonylcarbamoyladenosine biosynthesis protein TsaE